MKKLIFAILLCVPIALFAQKTQGLAMTPPMGWNSWNRFGCNISEQVIRETADAFVKNGFREAGYEYIVIDDCWQIRREKG